MHSRRGSIESRSRSSLHSDLECGDLSPPLYYGGSTMSFSKQIVSIRLALVMAATAIFLFASCGGNTGTSGEVRLQGAGATFPNPLYQKWLSEYGKTHPAIKIDYQSIGSGGGIKQIQAHARLLFVAKHLERIGDYVTDLCELTVYMAEAAVIKHT